MKSPSTVDHLKIFAAMLGAGLLAACGGGGTAGNSVSDTAATHFIGQQSDTTSSTADSNSRATTLTSDATSRSLTPEYLEAMTTTEDLKSIGAALLDVGTGSSDLDSPSDTVVAGVNTTDDLPPAVNTVRRLSAPTAVGQFVRFSQEGHLFTAPTNSVIRYGDPVTNRWVTRTASGNGECTNLFFRNDPAVGVNKVCQVWDTTLESIALATGPVWSSANANMPVIDLSRIPTPWIGFTTLQVQATAEVAPNSDIGDFRTSCGVAKLSFDDPIVYPGQVGMSHLHTFFGNTGVSASSTPDSLRNTGASTCVGGIANRSAYWVPTMIDTRTGTPLIPTGNGVYYKTGYDLPTSVIQPIPAGLRMIAGSAGATTPGSPGYRFKCIGGPNGENDKYGPQIANCDAGASLIQEIFFPQCWDGVNLDSPDHKSHMAYPSNGRCPSDHPVAIPAITFNVEYTVPSRDDPLHWRLSSDNYDPSQPGGYSSHGDWFNGWKSDISDAWARNCVMAVKDCHSHLLGDGRMMY